MYFVFEHQLAITSDLICPTKSVSCGTRHRMTSELHLHTRARVSPLLILYGETFTLPCSRNRWMLPASPPPASPPAPIWPIAHAITTKQPTRTMAIDVKMFGVRWVGFMPTHLLSRVLSRDSPIILPQKHRVKLRTVAILHLISRNC